MFKLVSRSVLQSISPSGISKQSRVRFLRWGLVKPLPPRHLVGLVRVHLHEAVEENPARVQIIGQSSRWTQALAPLTAQQHLAYLSVNIRCACCSFSRAKNRNTLRMPCLEGRACRTSHRMALAALAFCQVSLVVAGLWLAPRERHFPVGFSGLVLPTMLLRLGLSALPSTHLLSVAFWSPRGPGRAVAAGLTPACQNDSHTRSKAPKWEAHLPAKW